MTDYLSTIYNDPILFARRRGTYTLPFLPIVETVMIVNGKALLREIPNRAKRVTVSGNDAYWFEQMDSNYTELEDTMFQVDYVEGIVYFNASNEGKSLTFSYLGEGVHYFPDSRVYLTGDPKFQTFRDKLADIDRMYNEQKARVDTLITENPQPMEVVDLRVDKNGIVYDTARERVNALQEEQEETHIASDGTVYTSMKDRFDTVDTKVENINTSIDSINNDVSEINAAITTLNKKNTEVLDTAVTGQYYYYANVRFDVRNADFSLGIINDTHFDNNPDRTDKYNSLKEIKAFNNTCKKLPLNDMLVLGDIMNGDVTNSNFYNGLCTLDEYLEDYLVIHGNHDDGSYIENLQIKNPAVYGTRTDAKFPTFDIYNFFYRNNNVTEIDSNTMAFYKDYTSAKIRVIHVNTLDNPDLRNSDGTLRYPGINSYAITPRQLKWLNENAFNFTSKGSDASNWKVIIISHVPLVPQISSGNIKYWDGSAVQTDTTTQTYYPNYYMDDGVMAIENIPNEGILRQMIRNLNNGTNNTLKPYLNSETKVTGSQGYYFKTVDVATNPEGLSRELMTAQMHNDNYKYFGSTFTIDGNESTDFSMTVNNPYPVKVVACLSGHIHADKYHLMDTNIHHITLSAINNSNETDDDAIENYAYNIFVLKDDEFFIFRQGRNKGNVVNPFLIAGSTSYGVSTFANLRFKF